MNFLFLETNPTPGNLGDSWPMLLMLGGLFLVSILMTVIPQRKRKKQMMEMMNSIKVGDEVKTIGGMVGTIVSEDADNGYYVLNVGTSDSATLITISKTAVYTDRVAQPVPAEAPATEESAPNDDASVLNGGEEDAKASTLKD